MTYSAACLFLRNSTTAFGIGDFPARQRRTVRSSRDRTSSAKRRAERPDAFIASSNNSWSSVIWPQALKGECGDIVISPTPSRAASLSHRLGGRIRGDRPRERASHRHRSALHGERDRAFHDWPRRFRSHLDCPLTQEAAMSPNLEPCSALVGGCLLDACYSDVQGGFRQPFFSEGAAHPEAQLTCWRENHISGPKVCGQNAGRSVHRNSVCFAGRDCPDTIKYMGAYAPTQEGVKGTNRGLTA